MSIIKLIAIIWNTLKVYIMHDFKYTSKSID